VGAIVVAIGAITAMLVPAIKRSRQRREGEDVQPVMDGTAQAGLEGAVEPAVGAAGVTGVELERSLA
jgi:hypothetical protein